MKTFSFFYAAGSAGYVRGEQIADYLGGKKNPTSGFEDDICVYVKVIPPDKPPKNTYLDIDDAPRAVDYLKKHPEVGIISTCKTTSAYLTALLKRDDIVVIPHAHCNYERWVRPEKEVKTVGIIGSITSFQYPRDKFEKELAKIGLTLSYEEDYWNTYRSTEDKPGREKVCDFHKTIDIQVVWRPKMYAPKFKNPNKLANAGSFGIPTVSYPEESFVNEWGGYYIAVASIEAMVKVCRDLKEHPAYYRHYSDKVLRKAEENHIENISKLYLNL